jgi:membrane-bound ClpP family serine protease
MKNKKIMLIIIGITSLIMSIINFKYDNFIFISYLTVSLIAFIGLWEDIKNIWYHQSAHIIVSGIVSLIIGIYELLKYLFSWIAVYASGENIPDFKITIYLFTIFMIYIFTREINYLKNYGKNK